MSTMALEVAALPEYEFEDEYEYETEWEDEGEEFLGQLAGLARRAAGSPRLRRAARAAARAAGAGLGDVGAALGGPPRSAGAVAGGAAGAALGRVLADLFPQAADPEFEFEGELEANPIRRVYPDALMAHLAHRAAETGSEAEAEALIGALIPLAARLVPRAAPAIARAMPQLAQGIARAARALRATPSSRPLVRTLPQVARGTAVSLARQSARGAPVGPQRAVATLARQTARTLASPQQCAGAYRRNRSLDRVYHRQLQQRLPGVASLAGAPLGARR